VFSSSSKQAKLPLSHLLSASRGKALLSFIFLTFVLIPEYRRATDNKKTHDLQSYEQMHSSSTSYSDGKVEGKIQQQTV
jgi:hypothetical protein